MSGTKHNVCIVVLDTVIPGLIWGVFTSEKKARKAILKWKVKDPDNFGRILMFEIDYRFNHAPAKYLSDKTLESSDGIHSVDRNSAVRK